MKNLMIRTETLAVIKMNEIEDIGTDLSTSAHVLSDLVSYPNTLADEAYLLNSYKHFTHNGPELSGYGTKQCQAPDEIRFDIGFSGDLT